MGIAAREPALKVSGIEQFPPEPVTDCLVTALSKPHKSILFSNKELPSFGIPSANTAV